MNTRKVAVALIAVGVALAGVACEPSDERPSTPKQVREKYVDPRACEKYEWKNGRAGKCVKWDDKDWVIVTTDGKHYDVDEDEYNDVVVGEEWPK